MKAELTQLQRALACLAHASRFRILIELMDRPRFVSELARAVRLSQSCTTRHLQAMNRVGLVRGVRAGRRVFFEVERSTPVLAALAPWTDRAGSEPLRGAPDRAAAPARAGAPSEGRVRSHRGTRRGEAVGRAGSPAPRGPGSVPAGRASEPEAPPPVVATRRMPQDIEDFLL